MNGKSYTGPYMDASDPKWVNPNDIQHGVNSLWFGGLEMYFTTKMFYILYILMKAKSRL